MLGLGVKRLQGKCLIIQNSKAKECLGDNGSKVSLP